MVQAALRDSSDACNFYLWPSCSHGALCMRMEGPKPISQEPIIWTGRIYANKTENDILCGRLSSSAALSVCVSC